MTRIGRIGLVVLSIGLLQSSRAQTSAELAEAAAPLESGVPEVAIVRLRTLLGQTTAPNEWNEVAQKLAEALIASGQPKEALALLNDSRLRNFRTADFQRAQALASLHHWSEALPLYDAVTRNPDSSLRAQAVFGAAEALRALGRGDEARQKLAVIIRDKEWHARAQLRMAALYLNVADAPNAQRILASVQPTSLAERKMRRFLQGRLEMVEKHPERALVIFEALMKKPDGISHPLAIATLFQVADAHLQLKTPEAGDDFIEDFIEHHPADGDVALIFAKLDELYRAERKPARSELERWTRESEQPRRAFAQWYLARIDLRAGRHDRALRLLGEMRTTAPKIAALAPAWIEFAEFQMANGQIDDALSILEEARALRPAPVLLDRIDLIAARAQFRAGRYDKATATFERIANTNSPFAKLATFNAAIGRLESGDDLHFVSNYKQFENAGGDAADRAELKLNEGLSQAARGDERAAQTLQRFARDFPESKRLAEAFVALGELAFHRSPPALDEARKYLARAIQSKPTAAAAERAGYLSIWIEDASAGNNGKVIELSQQFLNEHADSSFAPDVRMKLAETYYRLQDFANAQTHFQILAQRNPPTPLNEKALFFAGESAMSSMGENALEQAIVLFDQVVQLNGDLRWAARNEQALIERKLGKPREALLLYDEVLKSAAKPAEKREALCGKGDVYVELTTEDPANYDRAIEAYGQLANEAHEPGHWRNQALFKKGVALEKKADRDGALTTFYDVLQTQTRPGRQPEFFWFYKAGFNAARLLEENAKWESAAAIYQKLVEAAGPRSEEAKARLNRLRLEHFLWQE